MKQLIVLFSCICIIGCSINRRTKEITYKPQENSKAYTIEVPGKSKMIFRIGNSYSYYFHYDNGYMFISNESGFWEENVSNKTRISDSLATYIGSAKYGSIPAIDTFCYQGIFNNRHWKEQLI